MVEQVAAYSSSNLGMILSFVGIGLLIIGFFLMLVSAGNDKSVLMVTGIALGIGAVVLIPTGIFLKGKDNENRIEYFEEAYGVKTLKGYVPLSDKIQDMTLERNKERLVCQANIEKETYLVYCFSGKDLTLLEPVKQ